LTIYTIGHSNHPIEHLLKMLADAGIELVVDVRSSPYSRYAEHFNKEPLEAVLKGEGIGYRFLGLELGGRPISEEFYDDGGRVRYDLVAQTEAFQAGIRTLLDEAGQRKTALLCGEESPVACHRRLLVGRVLMEMGIEVAHIRGDGRIQSEEEVVREEAATKGDESQMALFNVEEPREWKSTQSVSPRKTPRAAQPMVLE